MSKKVHFHLLSVGLLGERDKKERNDDESGRSCGGMGEEMAGRGRTCSAMVYTFTPWSLIDCTFTPAPGPASSSRRISIFWCSSPNALPSVGTELPHGAAPPKNQKPDKYPPLSSVGTAGSGAGPVVPLPFATPFIFGNRVTLTPTKTVWVWLGTLLGASRLAEVNSAGLSRRETRERGCPSRARPSKL